MFRKPILTTVTGFALSLATTFAFVSTASASESVIFPKDSIVVELNDTASFELAQAQETAKQKEARLKEERRLERQRKRAERARKRKERANNRPRFGSFF